MKLPSAWQEGLPPRRKRHEAEDTDRSTPGKAPSVPHPVRRAHGMESIQRFSLEAWLHAHEEK